MPTTSPELMRNIRSGKDALRESRRNAPLSEKLRQMVQAQHLYVQVVGSRRALNSLERPWNVLNVMSQSFVIGPHGSEPAKTMATSTRSQWLRQPA